MSAQEILSLFKAHNLIEEESVSDALELYDDDDTTFIFEIISEYLAEKVLWYSIAEGGWTAGIVDDFYFNVKKLAQLSDGEVDVKLLRLVPAKASNGVAEEDAEMEISFMHKDEVYEWKFTRNNCELFLEEFTKWAYKSLNGNYLFICTDHPIGYLLPKGFIKEIEKYGIISDINMFDREDEYDEEYTYEDPEFEAIGPELDNSELEKLKSLCFISEGSDLNTLKKYLESYRNIAFELTELDRKFEAGEEMEAELGDDFIALYESHGKTLVNEGMSVYFCEFYRRSLSGIKEENNLGTLIKRFEEAFYLTTTLLALFEEEESSDFLHEAIGSQEDFFVWKEFIVAMAEEAS